MGTPPDLARAIWSVLEPIHAQTYFAPEARAGFEAIGLRGFWRGYFAGRAAPLGPVGAGPVIGLFNGFAPSMVRRALPSVWELASPGQTLQARAAGAAAVLRRLVPKAATFEPGLAELEHAVTALEPAGRPLGAANAELAREDAYERLWQATTTLREHRGDGHVAALVTAGLAGVDSIVLRVGVDQRRAVMQPARGWSDVEWGSGAGRLQDRGWLDANGRATPQGNALLEQVERHTDALAAAAWDGIDVVAVGRVLAPVARACRAALPQVTPIGLPELWDPS